MRQGGKTGPEIETALASGAVSVPLSVREEAGAKILGLTDEEAREIARLEAPQGKEEEFTGALANIFAAWPVYAAPGLSKLEMASRVHKALSGRAGEEDTLRAEIPLKDIFIPAFPAAGSAGLYSSGIPGVFAEEKTVDFYDESSRAAFLRRVEKNRSLPKGARAHVLAALEGLPRLDEARKAVLNRALTRALSQYKAISSGTGMPAGELVRAAIQAAAGEGPENTLNRRVCYELPLEEFARNAARENAQRREKPLRDMFTQTGGRQEAPVLIIGGVGGTPLSARGFDKKSLREVYGYSEGEARKAEEFLYEIKLQEGLAPETLAGLIGLTDTLLRQEAPHTAADLRKRVYANFDELDGVSYNIAGEAGRGAYRRSGRYKAAGISPEAFEALRRMGNAAPPAYVDAGRGVAPVYRSRGGLAPLTRIAPRGMPEAISPAYCGADGALRPYELSLAQRSAYSRPAAEMRKSKTPSGTKPAAAPIRVSPRRSVDDAPAWKGEANSSAPPFTGQRPRIRSETPKPAHGNTLRPEEPEADRLRRMEANYERDKRMLAREEHSALARVRTHDAGRAEGREEEVLSRTDMEKLISRLEETVKHKLKKNLS
jgi:hypothetical protein